ncbi:MAG: hypothetical protein JW810_09460 [Sedimentisphaerales bacterium]|nr:hypothetical protein [Sedimentisphaerales bacterium]
MKRLLWILLPVLASAGCNWLEYPFFLLFGQTHENVKAEYTALADTRVAIVVAGLPAIEFEYPYARTDLALAAASVIRSKVDNVQFVEPETVEQFQRENLDWIGMPMADIARRFDVQRILYLELMQFATLEPESVNLVRGRIWTQASVYETDSDRPNLPAYETEIQVVYPEQAPLPMSDSTRQAVRQQMVLMYADELAKRFYDHKRPIK